MVPSPNVRDPDAGIQGGRRALRDGVGGERPWAGAERPEPHAASSLARGTERGSHRLEPHDRAPALRSQARRQIPQCAAGREGGGAEEAGRRAESPAPRLFPLGWAVPLL